MGDLTRAEMTEEVKKNLGNRVDFPETRVTRHLDLAQIRMARKHRFTELYRYDFVSIAPTGNPDVDYIHTFPVKIRDIHSLVRVNDNETPIKLIGMSFRQWAQTIGQTQEHTTGDPTHYVRSSPEIIQFWPVPSRSFTLVRRYIVWPGNLTLSGTKSGFEKKDDIIIAFATSSIFHSLGQKDDASNYFNIANSLLEDAILQDMERHDESWLPYGVSESSIATVDYVTDPFVRSAP